MMNSWQNLIYFFRLHSAEAEGTRLAGHPRRDWYVLNVVGVLLFLAGVVFDGWMYFSVVQNTRLEQSASVFSAGPSAQELDTALAAYAGRQSEHAALMQAPPEVADPAEAQ